MKKWNSNSVGRAVVTAVPAESAMERFEMLDRAGRRVSYVAFTDTDYGGLLFLDNTIHGTLSKRDAQAFYSCRGYSTATHYHWARDALDWVDTLIAAATPANGAKLDFTGKTTLQSIKEVVHNPLLSDIRSLVNIGSNPFSIFSKLFSAHDNLVEREKYEKEMQALRGLEPGDSKDKLAQIVVAARGHFLHQRRHGDGLSAFLAGLLCERRRREGIAAALIPSPRTAACGNLLRSQSALGSMHAEKLAPVFARGLATIAGCGRQPGPDQKRGQKPIAGLAAYASSGNSAWREASSFRSDHAGTQAAGAHPQQAQLAVQAAHGAGIRLRRGGSWRDRRWARAASGRASRCGNPRSAA